MHDDDDDDAALKFSIVTSNMLSRFNIGEEIFFCCGSIKSVLRLHLMNAQITLQSFNADCSGQCDQNDDFWKFLTTKCLLN